MRIIFPQLEAHFEGDVTSLATCWLIIRSDGEELGIQDGNGKPLAAVDTL